MVQRSGFATSPESYHGRSIVRSWTAPVRPTSPVHLGQRLRRVHCCAAGCGGRCPSATAVQSSCPTASRRRPCGLHRSLSRMRLIVQHHDQFARQPTVPPRSQAAGRRGSLARQTDRFMAADRSIHQPAECDIGMRCAPRGAALDDACLDPPRAHLRVVAGLGNPMLGGLGDNGQDHVRRLVEQMSNRPSNHIADPSGGVQLDEPLQAADARPGQTQRPTDGGRRHILSILDGSRASTSEFAKRQRFTSFPPRLTWTAGGRTAATNTDGAASKHPSEKMDSPQPDQSPGSGHA